MRLVHGRKSLTTREDEKTRRQPRPVRSQRPDSLPFGLRLPIDARLGQSETPDFLGARSDDNSSPVVPMGWPVIVYILPLAARGGHRESGSSSAQDHWCGRLWCGHGWCRCLGRRPHLTQEFSGGIVMGRMRQMSAVVAGCVLLAGCTSNNSDQAQDDTGGQATAASQQQAGQEGQSGQDGVEGRPFPGRCVHADHIDTTPVTTAPRSRWMTVQDIRVPSPRQAPSRSTDTSSAASPPASPAPSPPPRTSGCGKLAATPP